MSEDTEQHTTEEREFLSSNKSITSFAVEATRPNIQSRGLSGEGQGREIRLRNIEGELGVSSQVRAMPVTRVQSLAVSEDGQNAIVHREAAGRVLPLALPISVVPDLIMLLSTALSKSAQLRDTPSTEKWVAPAEWWEIGTQGDRLILSFQLTGGGELSFSVQKNRATAMSEALSMIAGGAPPAAPVGASIS